MNGGEIEGRTAARQGGTLWIVTGDGFFNESVTLKLDNWAMPALSPVVRTRDGRPRV
jgi:hypothetical protein